MRKGPGRGDCRIACAYVREDRELTSILLLPKTDVRLWITGTMGEPF